MGLGSTTPPLGMSKEGEMPEYLLNSKMLKLSAAESGFGAGVGGVRRGGVIPLASLNHFYSFFNLDAQVYKVAAG